MSDSSGEADAVERAKLALRRDLLARRRALAATSRAAAGHVQRELADLVRGQRPITMTGYVPVGSEPGGPDLPAVLSAALTPPSPNPQALDLPVLGPIALNPSAPGPVVPGPVDLRLLLPVLRADLDLDWAEYAGPDSLVPAGRGMREPTGARLGRWAIARAQLVVVPALAVDRSGIRLGRGGGSYDRALARVSPAALVVAVLHDGELVDHLPARPHDRPVHAVVTPNGGFQPVGPGWPGAGPGRPGAGPG
nr:5-formyltetrahydrofolate cyclo-ligase [Micromonospora sp. DSM 115978]